MNAAGLYEWEVDLMAAQMGPDHWYVLLLIGAGL